MTDLRPNSEIADGIHWLKGRGVNYYIVEENDDLIFIDTGMNKAANGIMEYIKDELSDKIPSQIYLTHHHLDHMGGLHELNTHFHPRKFAHKHDAAVINGKRPVPLPRNIFFRPIMWLVLKLIGPKRVEGIELVEDGQKQDAFEVYHLPGHTLGSVGFKRDLSMFSGDAAVTSGDEEIKIGPKIVAEDLDGVYRSFKRLASVEFDQILPGHGPPILEDASLRLQDALERYDL